MRNRWPYGGAGFYHHAPETSRDAAESVEGAAKFREEQAFDWIDSRAYHGGTADEVAEALKWEKYSSRPRLSTLKKLGKIVDSGKRRKGVSGRMMAVWVLPQFLISEEAQP